MLWTVYNLNIKTLWDKRNMQNRHAIIRGACTDENLTFELRTYINVKFEGCPRVVE